MAKHFLMGKMPGIWLLSSPRSCYQERSFYPGLSLTVVRNANPNAPGPHGSIALLWLYGVSICVIGSAKGGAVRYTLGPPSSLNLSHGPCLFKVNCAYVDRTMTYLLALTLPNVPADSRVAWAWLPVMPYARMTVHSPLKSIAVVYEYAFPLLLANKHSPFFSL
jgi:hypothetical protein